MTDAREATLELARRFFAAIAAGDLEAVRGMYALDAAIWHNHDGRTQSVEENLRVLGWATRNIAGFRYEEARLEATEGGFVERHVLRGRAPNGAELRVAACIVATVRDGRIARVEEYLDSAQIAALSG